MLAVSVTPQQTKDDRAEEARLALEAEAQETSQVDVTTMKFEILNGFVRQYERFHEPCHHCCSKAECQDRAGETGKRHGC